MSSTTGVQNFLVNVFRPVYKYEIPTGGSNPIFVPKLEVSNIDNYSGNTISVFRADVGDSGSNVYVGSNSGNPYTTVKGCRFVSAFGWSAGDGISNVSNSVFIGYNAGAGANGVTNNVIIGDATAGNGSSNVRIGSSNTGSGSGSSNVSIGAATSTSTYSNCILIGPGITSTANNQFRVGSNYLYGNLSTQWLGLGRSTPADPDHGKLDVSGNVFIDGQLGVNMVPTRTLDVDGDFRASDANGTLDFTLGVTKSTNGFASVQGTTTVSGGATTIGELKRGTVLVSAVSTTNSSKHAARHMIAYTTSNVDDLASNVTGGSVSITTSSSNIQITDASNGTYDWIITYFPLP